jgi:glyoxylase-like metal-dependent hydrolase (beta-lactamase superfamily II)/ferredoxin
MARVNERLAENAPGDLYVDRSCIDCDACRLIAPSVFARSEAGQSYVYHQPETGPDRHRALMALVACPTASIGTVQRTELQAATASFPELIEDDVYFCGFTSERSFGASSYFLKRPTGGNVLVDSPRASFHLMDRLEALGGVKLMFLTHRDDVADHDEYQRRFECVRALHQDDIGQGTQDVEQPFGGVDPIRISADCTLIPVPGHTRGSCALLYKERYLFTGDHLWWSPDQHRLHASRSVCWHSWTQQLWSLQRLMDFRFEWILPAHGARYHARSPQAMRAEIEELCKRLREAA